MIIYWSACISSLLLAYLGTHTRGYLNQKKFSVFLTATISSLPLLLLAAFRYGIGTDYNEYVAIYNVWIPRFGRNTIEPIFYYLNKAIYFLAGDRYQWLFIITSIIYFIFTFSAIYKMSPSPCYSIFLLFSMTYYLSFFNTTREHVGCAILLFSIVFLEKRNYKMFFALVVLASGFHYTCAIFALSYLFTKIKLSPKRVILWSAAFVLSQGVILLLVRRFFSSSIRYSKYLYGSAGFNINNVLGVALQLFLLVVVLYFYKYFQNDKKYNIYLGLQMLSLWINILAMSMTALARIKWVYSFPSIILVPYLLSGIENKRTKRIISILICVIYIAYITIVVGVFHSFGVIPYKSIFSY